jgi:hypothetical protein
VSKQVYEAEAVALARLECEREITNAYIYVGKYRKRQLLLAVIFILVLMSMLVYPPWTFVIQLEGLSPSRRDAGYHLLWSAPELNPEENRRRGFRRISGAEIDYPQLALQTGVAVCLTSIPFLWYEYRIRRARV